MRRTLRLSLPFLALAGCAGPSLQSRMAAYIGTNEPTLVRQLGVPDRAITVGDVQYLAYERQSAQTTGAPYGWFFPSVFETGLYSPQILLYSCVTTFFLTDGRVFNFTLRGNACD